MKTKQALLKSALLNKAQSTIPIYYRSLFNKIPRFYFVWFVFWKFDFLMFYEHPSQNKAKLCCNALFKEIQKQSSIPNNIEYLFS